ncbi:unnamed protein product [Acanthoscelides obtectus]|uniref:Uncharacterized protein n=1 Tax=Acanthoscelides obtectus TaxID=200917 RepID=A0A9P0LB26_ACAOB|nr:unnamed protein product [Acanthoscelides obtectus]CAK1635199.1 hypothetical protein AOBTE_LOCUS9131 [Acanthoscelides obtectus]
MPIIMLHYQVKLTRPVVQRNVLLLKGILSMISDAGLCKTVFKISSTAGKINFFPIVWGFPDFAISNEIL